MWVRHHRKNREKAAAVEQAKHKVAEDPRYPPEDRINPRDFSTQQKKPSSLAPIEEEAKHNEKASFQTSSRQGSLKDDRVQHGQEPERTASVSAAVGEESKLVQRDAQPNPSREPGLQEEHTPDTRDPLKPVSRVPTTKDELEYSKPDLRHTTSDPPPVPSTVAPADQDLERSSKPPSRANTALGNTSSRNLKF